MRYTLMIVAGLMLASSVGIGCSSSKETIVRRETVTVPAKPEVVERTTTIEQAPVVQEHTTIRRQKSTTTTEY